MHLWLPQCRWLGEFCFGVLETRQQRSKPRLLHRMGGKRIDRKNRSSGVFLLLFCNIRTACYVFLGIWMPRRHVILWSFRWARTVGSFCRENRKRIDATIVAAPLATRTCSSFSWTRIGVGKEASTIRVMEAFVFKNLCCYRSRARAASKNRYGLQWNNCPVHS